MPRSILQYPFKASLYVNVTHYTQMGYDPLFTSDEFGKDQWVSKKTIKRKLRYVGLLQVF